MEFARDFSVPQSQTNRCCHRAHAPRLEKSERLRKGPRERPLAWRGALLADRLGAPRRPSGLRLLAYCSRIAALRVRKRTNGVRSDDAGAHGGRTDRVAACRRHRGARRRRGGTAAAASWAHLDARRRRLVALVVAYAALLRRRGEHRAAAARVGGAVVPGAPRRDRSARLGRHLHRLSPVRERQPEDLGLELRRGPRPLPRDPRRLARLPDRLPGRARLLRLVDLRAGRGGALPLGRAGRWCRSSAARSEAGSSRAS